MRAGNVKLYGNAENEYNTRTGENKLHIMNLSFKNVEFIYKT